MKIVRLQAENVKRLVAVDITPKGNIVEITGKNGNGKSSVLDSIYMALGGASQIPGEPIRKGQTKARIKLDMGELVVTRNFTKGGTTLTVEDAEGIPKKSPQKILDDLFGAIAFDPFLFSRMKAREQYETLKGLAHVDLDLDKLDALNAKDYEARTVLNRDAKAARAQADGIVIPEDPGTVASVDEYLKAIDQANVEKQEVETANHNRESLERAIKESRTKFAALRAELVVLKAKIEDLDTTLEGLAPLETTNPIDERIASLREEMGTITAKATLKAQRDSAIEQKATAEALAGAKESQAASLTESMEARTKAKTDAIAAAKMPIQDLGFGDGVVLYQGVPFDQASSAEQLKVSTAIAMAANPKLRVIRITDGSLLDEDSMAMLQTMAAENDFQIWLEVVSSDQTVGIVISDGSVVADNQVSEPTKTLLECAIAAEPGAKAILAQTTVPDTTPGLVVDTTGPVTIQRHSPLEDLKVTTKGASSAYDALLAQSVINKDEKLDRKHSQGLDLDIP